MDFQQQIVALLQTVILGILNIGAGYIVYYFKQMAENAKYNNQKIEDEKKRELLDNAIDRVNNLIKNSVIATNETLGNSIRKDLEDGKIDKEELYALKDVVMKDVLGQITNDTKSLLSTEIKDLNAYIGNNIEVILKELKDKEN